MTLRIKGDGPLGTLLVVADNEGNVRGSVQNPQLDLPIREDGKLDVGGAVGHGGMLTVIKDLNLKEPYVGSVELLGGEIAEDLASYFVESEQIPTACGLGVLVDRDRSVLRAGGYLIAREVSGKGFSVVYDTAGHIFERFEAQKFGRDEAERDVERVLNCDLLILDDLGTEMVTTFVQSALYQIINGRLLEKKSTIVSTNLMPEAIAQRYSGQIASRIEGEYQLLPFVGEDIRVLKKKRGL